MNSKIAFIYPGQASQYVGMASDLYDSFPKAVEYFNIANKILGFDLHDVCFNGPEDLLKQTYVTQPAIFVHSCIVSELLKARQVQPSVAAGHSLGEYSALVAAGALSFEDALNLVKLRGAAMQAAGEKNPGTMAAIIGMSAADVDELCRRAGQAGVVRPANYNSPGQIVISGSESGVAKAIELAKDMGARKAVPLVVSGAFHSPLMEPARESLRDALETTAFQDARIPVYTNVTAKPETRATELKKLLDLQLISPVRWQESVENMIQDGVGHFYEVGPGRVLTGLVRRIDRAYTPTSVDSVDDLEKLMAQ